MKLKGALWGRGEMSIESGTKQGDDEGIGGVVTPSHRTGGVVAPSAGEHVSTGTKTRRSHGYAPLESICWNRFDVKRDRRGVASWGLEQRLLAAGLGVSYARESVPLVDMQIGGHVGGQTRSGRRATHGLVEVVHVRLLHAQVTEVEALGAEAVCTKQRPRGGQVATIAPGPGDRWRMHSGERRGHLHDGGGNSVLSSVFLLLCLSCWATGAIASVCGRSFHSMAAGTDKHTVTRNLIPI